MSLLIKNANISTMDEANPKADAAVVTGKYFAYVGTEAGAREYIAAHDDKETYEEVDCGGQLLIPGFNDSHLHFLHYVKTCIHVDLVGCKSLKECLGRMAEAWKTFDTKDGLWFVGEGWNQDYFEDEKRFPTRWELDEITADWPIMIQRTCGHVGILNSKALELFDMSTGEGFKYKQYADKDANGELNGCIKENLFDYFKTTLPAPKLDKLMDLMEQHQYDLFAKGVTSVQSDEGNYAPAGEYHNLQNLMRERSEKGSFKLRLSSQMLYFNKEKMQWAFENGYTKDFGNDTVKISATKLLVDGSLGARTALMRKPYADDPSVIGLSLWDQEGLNEMVLISHKQNIPVAVHAIGDGAVEMVINAVENARKACPHLNPRHTVVHSQVTDRAMLERMKALDISVMVQPIFIDYDMHVIYERVGKEMAESSYVWKWYKDMGIHMSFGTDCPVESFDPMQGLYCAVTRLAKNGDGPYLPEQALSVGDAIYAYTAESAWNTGDEELKGKIKSGMLADFITVDRDLYEIDPKDILNAKVTKTYIGGEKVFEA
ncbi:MAG: amidohydrolase [Clostridia bacterium]|nr:amidohydrolase [Clostridia bacterium]